MALRARWGEKQVPTVVMAHGFSCLKEMFLDKYAEVFVKDGLAVLVYATAPGRPVALARR